MVMLGRCFRVRTYKSARICAFLAAQIVAFGTVKLAASAGMYSAICIYLERYCRSMGYGRHVLALVQGGSGNIEVLLPIGHSAHEGKRRKDGE